MERNKLVMQGSTVYCYMFHMNNEVVYIFFSIIITYNSPFFLRAQLSINRTVLNKIYTYGGTAMFTGVTWDKEEMQRIYLFLYREA